MNNPSWFAYEDQVTCYKYADATEDAHKADGKCLVEDADALTFYMNPCVAG